MSRMARLTCIVLLLRLALPPAAGAAPATSPTLPAASVRAWQTGVLRPDRLQHASFTFTLGLGIGLLTKRPAAAAAGAFTIGLAKEVRDRGHGGFDPVDLLADAIGAGLAAACVHTLAR